jgi:hypothetical protein
VGFVAYTFLPSYHHFRNLLFLLMLLFFHFAFQFRWPRTVKIMLRAWAFLWATLVLFAGLYEMFTPR